MDHENQPELRLVGDADDSAEAGERDENARGHGDLVADVIRESGLLPPEQVDQAQRRAAGDSFSQALVDEGLAGALGVARTLAEKYHLPLVDLAVAGVDAAGGEDDRAAGAQPRRRDPVRLGRQHAQGGDHRPAGRARARRAAARDAPVGGVLRRGEERRPHRDPPPLARGRGDERDDGRGDRRRGGRRGGGRRARGRRRHLRRAARPPRQLDDLPGRRGRGQRHPRRAAGGRSRRPLPDRRRPPRCPPHSEAAGLRRDDPPQGAREARHRRAAQAAGRADLAQRRGRGTHARHPRGDAPHGRGRGGHHAPARQVARRADARGARPLRPDERADGGDPRPADGGAPRHGADRIGQVDDALRGAERDQPAGDQHHHRRGSRRVSARRRQARCRSTPAQG